MHKYQYIFDNAVKYFYTKSILFQLANIGPISYSIFRALAPQSSRSPNHWIILVLLLVGSGASLGLALSWKVTSEV